MGLEVFESMKMMLMELFLPIACYICCAAPQGFAAFGMLPLWSLDYLVPSNMPNTG